MIRQICALLTFMAVFIQTSLLAFAQGSDSVEMIPILVLSGDSGNFFLSAVIGIVGGIIVAFAITGSMIAEMNTARKQTEATDYVRQETINITHRQDIFLYENTVVRELDNDDHDDDDDNDFDGDDD